MMTKKYSSQFKPIGSSKWTRMAVLIFLVFFSLAESHAQKGLFVKISMGSGYIQENTGLKKAGWSLVTKNHAIGYGITDKFALQVGELGGLVKMKVKEYDFVNINGFGVGFNYRIRKDINWSVLGASGSVAFAKKWTDPSGDSAGKGYGFNMSLDKEWFLGNRWGLRLGPHFFWFKTTDSSYQFFDAGLNASVVFYLTPFREKE